MNEEKSTQTWQELYHEVSLRLANLSEQNTTLEKYLSLSYEEAMAIYEEIEEFIDEFEDNLCDFEDEVEASKECVDADQKTISDWETIDDFYNDNIDKWKYGDAKKRLRGEIAEKLSFLALANGAPVTAEKREQQYNELKEQILNKYKNNATSVNSPNNSASIERYNGTRVIDVKGFTIYQAPLVSDLFGTVVYSSYDGVKISFQNLSDKTIKYITFCFNGHDSVKELVPVVGGAYSYTLKVTGPISTKQTATCQSGGIWPHGFVKSNGMISLDIEYMDGSRYHWEYDEGYDKIQSPCGCYVATCVYGSYDCPEVWTLRRFRDYTLAETWYGRLFIKTYYAISPTIVKWFGKTKWFKKMWKPSLDNMVNKLNTKGISSDPYQDKEWF